MPEPILPLIEYIDSLGSDHLPTFGGKFRGGYYIQQHSSEFASLIEFLKKQKPFHNYCEIGIAAGGTTRAISELVGFESALLIDDGRHPQFSKTNINLQNVPHRLYVGDSHSILAGLFLEKELQGGKLDLVFIDGDHSLDGVRRDLDLVIPFCDRETILVFHDIHSETGVAAFWKGERRLEKLEEFCHPEFKLGIGVGRISPIFNCAHFCYPLKTNDQWLENIKLLRPFSPKFNGKKIAAIVKGSAFVDVNKVKSELGEGFRFLEIDPSVNFGEGKSLIPMMGELESFNDFEHTFYCHSKGAGRWNRWNEHRRKNVEKWRELMYRAALENFDYIANILKQYAACGSFLRDKGRSRVNNRDFPLHFVGNFWWVNNKRFFSKNWRHFDFGFKRWGAEAYLGDILDKSEVFDLLNFEYQSDVFSEQVYTGTHVQWEPLFAKIKSLTG